MTEPKPPYLHRIQVIVEIVVAASTVAAVMAAVLSAREARRSANEAARSADYAWQMFELQRRPWLVARLSFEGYDPVSQCMQLRVALKNCGAAPAVGLNVLFRSDTSAKPNAYTGRSLSTISWATGGLYLPSGDSVNQVATALKYMPVIDSTIDTNYVHVCCFFANAESRAWYYYETVYALSGLRPVHPEVPRDKLYYYEMSMVGRPCFGRVVNDTVVTDSYSNREIRGGN